MEFRLRFVLHTVFPLFPHMGRNDGALAGFGVNEPSLFYLFELLFHGQFVITSLYSTGWIGGSMLVWAWLHASLWLWI
jgi:hypothetical protein